MSKEWIIDTNNDEDRKISDKIEVLDLDTGEFLRRVGEANFKTGEYGEWDEDCKAVYKKGNIICVYKGK